MREHVDAVAVDSHDAAGVARATTGVDALFWVDPTTGGQDPLAEYAAATAAVVRAVTDNGIGRVAFQSRVGAEQRHGAGGIDGLAAIQVALDALEVDVTHLRCGFFSTNLLLQVAEVRAGTVHVVLPLDLPLAWVAPRDIAEVAVTRLLSTAWSGRCVQAVHGPADLTWAQAAAAATGRPLRVARIPDEAMRATPRGGGGDRWADGGGGGHVHRPAGGRHARAVARTGHATQRTGL